MEKSMKQYGKTVFESDALLAPKLNNLYSQKKSIDTSINLEECIK
jgi:hypothetical protein